jgi:uncharacterized protein YkwD
MSKKLFIVTSLMAIMLSACGGQSPVETATPAITESPVPTVSVTVTTTATLAATATLATSTTLPTNTSLPATPMPTNPPDCTNQATFVADVTIPDNTEVAAGALFTKTWRIGNLGTCTWGPDYTLTHYSDERMSALSSVPLDIAPPGEFLEISVDLRAPNSIGTHRGNFVIKNPAGLIMSVDDDSRLWVIIDVTDTVAVTATATATATSTATRSATAIPGTASGSVTATSTGLSDTTSSLDSATAAPACSYTTDSNKLTETIAAVNTYRARNNLPAYTLNTLLAKAAQRHANDMACNKLFTHKGSDDSTPQSRVAATGYVASSVSENIYGSYPPLTGQGVVNWWINDKTDLRHNQNLLSTTFTQIGVGYSFYENFGYYVLVVAKP